ncbi:MAG: hypothetical protein IJI66_03170 [Erysipelotrichaceae bacterium]|nr:hypothetical protein [Erysipelotrichaceae bacterium]
MKQIKYILVFLFLLSACGSGINQKEIDKTINEYKEKISDVTWHGIDNKQIYRFNFDGSVEEYMNVSEPNNWELYYGNQWHDDVTKMSKSQREKCGYYLSYTSPLYGDKTTIRVSFNEDGDLVLGEYTPTTYKKGIDVYKEIPEDVSLDDFFIGTFPANNWGVFADVTGDESKEGELWIFQDDGLGAKSVGSYNGELINPTHFRWGVKDDLLFIEVARDEEWIKDYGHHDLYVYKVEKGDKEFWLTPYLEIQGVYTNHYRVTNKVDIYSW